MVTDNYPFPEANTDLVALGHIVQNKSPEPLTPWNEPFAQVFELSKRCWRIDPEERPSVDECVSVLGPPPPLPPLRKKPAAAGGSKGKPKKRPQSKQGAGSVCAGSYVLMSQQMLVSRKSRILQPLLPYQATYPTTLQGISAIYS